MGGDVFSICCSLALFFVYLKAIYLVTSAWITDISLRNPFIVIPQIDLTNSRMRGGTSEQRSRQIFWLRCCALSVVSWQVANVVKLQRNTSPKSIYANKVDDTIMMDNPPLSKDIITVMAKRVIRGISK
jgi:hypothetical protein